MRFEIKYERTNRSKRVLSGERGHQDLSNQGIKARKVVSRKKLISTRKMAGFAMMGTALALAASSILILISTQSTINSFKNDTGKNIGTQLQTLANALNSYILANQKALTIGSDVAGVAVDTAPSVVELKALGFLTNSFPATPSLGGNYKIQVSFTAPPCVTCLVGKVYIDKPFLVGSTGSPLDIRTLSAAREASLSNQIGFSLSNSTNLISGAGWSFTNPVPGTPGILYATTNIAQPTQEYLVEPEYWIPSVINCYQSHLTGNIFGNSQLDTNSGKPYRWTSNSAAGALSNWGEFYSGPPPTGSAVSCI